MSPGRQISHRVIAAAAQLAVANRSGATESVCHFCITSRFSCKHYIIICFKWYKNTIKNDQALGLALTGR